MQVIRVSNLNEYEYYLENESYFDNEIREHKLVWDCLNDLPTRGFRPNLISFEIIVRVSSSYKQTFIETFPTLQFPDTLQSIKIKYTSSSEKTDIKLPDLSLLTSLKILELENLNFITFTDLPRSLLQLNIKGCLFSRDTNRQILQTAYLPNGFETFGLIDCYDVYALPLLPLSLKTIKVIRSGFHANGRFIELERLYNKQSLWHSYLSNSRKFINELNKRTLILRKQRHMGEYDDLMYVTSLRDADAHFVLDTAKEELKDFIGGKNKSKKHRIRGKNTRRNKH